MIGLCDDPDRIGARIYAAVRFLVDKSARQEEAPPDCPCCAFWRGATLFGAIGLAVGLIAAWLVR